MQAVLLISAVIIGISGFPIRVVPRLSGYPMPICICRSGIRRGLIAAEPWAVTLGLIIQRIECLGQVFGRLGAFFFRQTCLELVDLGLGHELACDECEDEFLDARVFLTGFGGFPDAFAVELQFDRFEFLLENRTFFFGHLPLCYGMKPFATSSARFAS